MKISNREKRFLMFLGGALIIFALYEWVATPLITGQQAVRAKIDSKKVLLSKSLAKISEKETLAAKIKRAEELMSRAEKKLLPGETPSLAAAELQRILKHIANKAKINVSSEKIISPVEVGEYQKIPVRITLRCLVTDLKNFLHQVESHKVTLLIPETIIKVINRRDPGKVEATLTVAGIIKKAESAEQKSKKKSRNKKG